MDALDIEQLEQLALGTDRAAALAALLPGTVEHDYWRGVSLQHAGRLDEVDALLEEWPQRHEDDDEHLTRLRARQLILRAGRDLAGHAEALGIEVGVSLDDRPETVAAAERFPTRLDPAVIDGTALVDAEVRRRRDVDTLTDRALEDLVRRGGELEPALLHATLGRLTRADLPGLVRLVARDLEEKTSGGFGSLNVHARFTRDQLEELASRRPSLRQEPRWVQAMLQRLRPPSHVDVVWDRGRRGAWLDQLWAFASMLPATFNEVKAHIQYHRLDLQRSLGRYDPAELEVYLALPRRTAYVVARWLKRFDSAHVAAPVLSAADPAGLPRVDDDEPLVRDFLARLLLDDDGGRFADQLRADWLREILATTRLLAGAQAEEAARWAKVLGPAQLAELAARVDIELTPTNPGTVDASAPVALEFALKNVRELHVKVFRIDVLAYALTHGSDVDTSVDLDGLVASAERVVRFDAPPMQRVIRRLELPECERPGTYVVELIGNGRSSRALIRKGRLRHAVRTGAAGVLVTIFDELGAVQRDARIWAAGRELRPRDDGGIVLPFSTRGGRTPVLLVHGGIVQRELLAHPGEEAELRGGFHLEREALVAGSTARLLCSPVLTLAGAPVSLALLTEPRVLVSTCDASGVSASRTTSVTLEDGADVVVEIHVPADVTNISVRLQGRVRLLSTAETVEVDDGVSAEVNGVHATPATAALHLTTTSTGHLLRVLGKTGEPLARRAVVLSLQHRMVRGLVSTTLESNERGEIDLGGLAEVERLGASLAGDPVRWWELRPQVPVVRRMHVLAGEAVELPAPDDLGPADVCLMEERGGAPAHDRTDHVRIERGALIVGGLEAGDYKLRYLGAGADSTLLVVPAGSDARWAPVPDAMVELSEVLPLVRTARVEGEKLVVELSGTGPDTRLHVAGLRFRPDAVLADGTRPPSVPVMASSSIRPCSYVSGRDIGDEHRYVLERRTAPRRPGSMLDKPGLLLAPWALRETSSDVHEPAPADLYQAARGASLAKEKRRGAASHAPAMPAPEAASPSVDFLAGAAPLLAGLRPDADGRITIPLSQLGGAQLLRLRLVDPRLTYDVEVALPRAPLAVRDLALRLALDPERHYAEERRVEGVLAGTRLVLDDVRTGKLELIDTVARALQVLRTLRATAEDDEDGARLRDLTFLGTWSTLDHAARCAEYGRHACHEVNLFLWRKDPEFFATVVSPFLAHKRHKTFVDRFLLDEDLAAYLDPWAFGRLNTVEKILLGLRTPAARSSLARLVGDEVELIARDPEGDARLLDTLLGVTALEPSPSRMREASGSAYPMSAALEEEADEAPSAQSPPAPRAGPASGIGGGGGRDALALDRMDRGRDEPFYRTADSTQELAETIWWKTRIEDATPDLVPPNRFWNDLARHEGGGPFLSPFFTDCASSVAAAVCALAFLDLPFESRPPARQLDEMRLVLTPRGHTLAARTGLTELAGPAGAPGVLLGQSYFRADDRWAWDGAEQREKQAGAELLTGVVYCTKVVVTNPTGMRQDVDVLLQIPRGAMAVSHGFTTRTTHLRLQPYGTQSLEYAFYFPRPGSWTHFPAHVSRAGQLLAAAGPRTFDVRSEATGTDVSSWAHVSQRGSLEEVLGFLQSANLGRVDLTRIAWRMHTRTAFERVTRLLAERHVYDDTLWSYALVHHDRVRAGQWLRHREDLLQQTGPLDEANALVSVDPVARGWYQHLEYAPLIHARAHQLGARRRILDAALAAQYRALLEMVAHRPRPTDADLLDAAQYLFCLERGDDAAALLARINPTAVTTRLQYDYLAAYDACHRGDLGEARRLATPWLAHPVERWKSRFRALVAMLDEAAGLAVPEVVDLDNRNEQMTASATREPSLGLKVEHDVITVEHHNLAACQLRFYRMDTELLFSRQPFVQGEVERFSWIEPGEVLDVPLASDGSTKVPLPESLDGVNLVIEAVAPGLRAAAAHYRNDLSVQVAHGHGQLRVVRASTRGALPATYVKVYGRQSDGRVAFYKDGYTDLRGRFDYATLSTNDLDRVERFALLVVSDEAGTTILEVAPPRR